MSSRLFARFIVSDEEASTARVSDGCPKKYERQKLFKVSVQCPVSHCLYWWAMKPFFSQATMLMQDLETKKARHAVLKNKLMLQGVGEEMSEDVGLQSLADSVANTLREKIMCAMSLIKRRQEMINKETGFPINLLFSQKN